MSVKRTDDRAFKKADPVLLMYYHIMLNYHAKHQEPIKQHYCEEQSSSALLVRLVTAL